MIKIGLETHISLNKLNSKLFCSCSLPNLDSKPNTHTCPVCLGHPGSKPVLNKTAFEQAIKLAIALNCKINKTQFFSRKTYFYPDMPKNYQITQYEIPIGEHGYTDLENKKINLTRLHLEEDPGALIHPSGMQTSSYVLIDYNRSGIPLCEIVTEPDLTSPEEARDFLKKLIETVNYLNIYDPLKSTVKVDANISIKESGFIKTEIKNISGFKEVERALKYEIQRQKLAVKNKEKIIQETRAWNADKGITFSLRTKETEEDYGYITDPDLPIFEITNLEEIKNQIPELAQDKVKRYTKEFKLSKKDSEVIAAEHSLAILFEKVAKKINPILAAKWLRRELIRVLNYNKKSLHEIEIDESHLIDLLNLIDKKQITETNAQKILEKLIEKPFNVNEYVKKQDLKVITDTSQLEEICKKVIKENPKAVQDYKLGEEKSLHFLIGKVMAITKGQASPKEVNSILRKLIK